MDSDSSNSAPTDDDGAADDVPPAVVRTFIAAHAARDTEAALRAFAEDALVVDQGETFRGRDGVTDFLDRAGAQYTYTTKLISSRQVDDRHWVVTVRLEGDFPGGVVDLHYRFSLDEGRVAELVIVTAS